MKNIKLAFSLIIFISYISNAQEKTEIGCNKYTAMSARMNFENDLKNNSLVIYLQGGIVSVIKETDHDFEKLYKIQYYDFGCTIPSDMSLELYKIYNQFVFEYLKEKFGNEWQKTLNPNAFGWNNTAKF